MRKTGILSAATMALGAVAFAGIAAAETPVAGKTPAAAAGAPTVTPAAGAAVTSPAGAVSGAAPSAPAKATAAPAATPSGAAITPAPTGSSSFTDSQLESYLGVQRELTVLNASGVQLSNPTPDTQAKIAGILQRYSIDGQTYNQISATAKADKKLAERIASLKTDSTVKTQ